MQVRVVLSDVRRSRYKPHHCAQSLEGGFPDHSGGLAAWSKGGVEILGTEY